MALASAVEAWRWGAAMASELEAQDRHAVTAMVLACQTWKGKPDTRRGWLSG